MDVSRPYSAVAPSLDGDVLVQLAGLAAPVSGRELARRIPWASQPAVNSAVDRLAKSGVVLRQSAPPANLYLLNREHLAYPAVEAMAGMRSAFYSRLRNLFAISNVRIAHASVFGSFARADGDASSDIDLLIVWGRTVSPDVSDDLVGELESKVRSWTGNELNVAEIWLRQLPGWTKTRGKRFLEEVMRDGILVAGRPLDVVLG